MSLNAGVDWTKEATEAEYYFEHTPQITSLSHYSSDLRASYGLTIYGFHFPDNVELCIFGSNFISKAVYHDS